MPGRTRPWTESECDLLRSIHGSVSFADMAAQMGRTSLSVQRKAVKLGLRKKGRWTESEDAKLRKLWRKPELSLRSIARSVGHTPGATYAHAKYVLRLPVGVPPSYGSLNSASARSGFARSHLRTILDWVGVPVYQIRGPNRRGGGAYNFVDPDEVDRAVSCWMGKMSVNVASSRVGVTCTTFRRWLADAGFERPPGRVWFLTADVAARVAASHGHTL